MRSGLACSHKLIQTKSSSSSSERRDGLKLFLRSEAAQLQEQRLACSSAAAGGHAGAAERTAVETKRKQYFEAQQEGGAASTESELQDKAEAEARGKRGRSRSMSEENTLSESHFKRSMIRIPKGSVSYDRGFRDERPAECEVPTGSTVRAYFHVPEHGQITYRIEKRNPEEQDLADLEFDAEAAKELEFHTEFDKKAAETKDDLERRVKMTAMSKKKRQD